MTLSNKMGAYPVAFHEIATKGWRSLKPFDVLCGSEKEAIGFRMQWYGFLKAVDLASSEEKPLKDAEGNLIYPLANMAVMGRGLQVSIKGRRVVFTPREITQIGTNADRLLNSLENSLASKFGD